MHWNSLRALAQVEFGSTMFLRGRSVAPLLARLRGCGIVRKKAHYRKRTPNFRGGHQPQLLHGSSVATARFSKLGVGPRRGVGPRLGGVGPFRAPHRRVFLIDRVSNWFYWIFVVVEMTESDCPTQLPDTLFFSNWSARCFSVMLLSCSDWARLFSCAAPALQQHRSFDFSVGSSSMRRLWLSFRDISGISCQ